jgi:Uma2 family endonuclease
MSTAVPILPPPLRDGDRLSREEFLRRWEAMPDLKHAELIDGVVYMSSPVGLKHSDIHGPLTGWLFSYAAKTPGCRTGVEGTWLMGINVLQPDITLRILPEYGGQSREEAGYASGAPELVVEVSASSTTRDLGPKLHLYQRARVREYITALVDKEEIIWRELVKGRYRTIAPATDGILRSNVFPGLWLDAAALWRIDLPSLLATLQQGFADPQHEEFVRRLSALKRVD